MNAIDAAAISARAAERKLPLKRVPRLVLNMSTTLDDRPSDVRPPAKTINVRKREADVRAVRGEERLKWRGGGDDRWDGTMKERQSRRKMGRM